MEDYELRFFRVLGENLFIIEFDNAWDKSRVLEGRPWIFEGHLFSVKDFNGLTPPTQMVFEKAAFWVRMYNLPLACMGTDIGFKIGSSVGKVEDVDVTYDGVGWGEYLRVKITLDLMKPLSRGRMLKMKDSSVWVAFQYEKLPKFCFKCGIIRHGATGCLSSGGRRTQGVDGAAQFGGIPMPAPSKSDGSHFGNGWAVHNGRSSHQAAEKEDVIGHQSVRRDFLEEKGEASGFKGQKSVLSKESITKEDLRVDTIQVNDVARADHIKDGGFSGDSAHAYAGQWNTLNDRLAKSQRGQDSPGDKSGSFNETENVLGGFSHISAARVLSPEAHIKYKARVSKEPLPQARAKGSENSQPMDAQFSAHMTVPKGTKLPAIQSTMGRTKLANPTLEGPCKKGWKRRARSEPELPQLLDGSTTQSGISLSATPEEEACEKQPGKKGKLDETLVSELSNVMAAAGSQPRQPQ